MISISASSVAFLRTSGRDATHCKILWTGLYTEWVDVCVSMSEWVCVRVSLNKWVGECACICVYICVCVCVCLNVYCVTDWLTERMYVCVYSCVFHFLYYDVQLYGRRRGLILCGIHIMSPLSLQFCVGGCYCLVAVLEHVAGYYTCWRTYFESFPSKAVYICINTINSLSPPLLLIYF